MFPVVRIEVDHMKQAIAHAFSERQLQTDEQFTAALDAAITHFDFKAEIERAATIALRDAVGHAAKYAVEEALRKARGNASVIDAVAQALHKALTDQAINERYWEEQDKQHRESGR